MKLSACVLAFLLCTSSMLCACAKENTPPAETNPPATSSATAPTPAPAASTSPAPAATPASTATAPAPSAGAIASTDGEKPGIHIDVTQLKRASGGTLNLEFTLTNGSDKTFDMYSAMSDPEVTAEGNKTISGIHLIDPVNKKKYFVITDSGKHCVCSTDIDNIPAGQKVNLWAKFPAPPADVQKISIEIPHFQPIDDAAISQ